MIFDILIAAVSSLIEFIAALLLPLDTLVPTEIISSFIWIFSHLNYFRGIFPITTLIEVIVFIFTILGSVYTMKIIFFALRMIPFIGDKIPHNSISTSIHTDSQGKVTGSHISKKWFMPR